MIHDSIIASNQWQYADAADVVDTTAVVVQAAKAGYRHRVMAVQATNSDIAVGSVIQIFSDATLLANIWVAPFVAAAPGADGTYVTFPMPLMGNIGGNINFVVVTTSAQVRTSFQGVTQKAS